MGTKNNPAKYDCYANAKPDEPMFVLLARDPSAPGLVRSWARTRQVAIMRREKPESDMEMVREAYALANEMEKWRAANWKK